MYAVIQEAFGWNRSFEDWANAMIRQETFDPRLWFLAIDGSEIAGVALCPRYADYGWVRQLAVRPGWRGRGLGLALLRHTFAEFYRRGQRRVGLGVDAANATGATRLYERAGMRVTKQFDRYEKELDFDQGAQ